MPVQKVSRRTHSGRDALRFFDGEIDRYSDLLTREEELQLVARWRMNRDKAAMNQLVGANLRFLIQIVAKYTSTGIRLEDLTQEAVIGFMKGIEKYDEQRGIRLLTYCIWWIRAYVQLYIIRNWSLVALSNPHRRIFFSIGKMVQRWRSENPNADREPTAEDLAPLMGVKVEEVDEMMLRTSHDLSLQTILHDDRDTGETLQDEVCCTRPTQDVKLEDAEQEHRAKTKIRQSLWYLNDKERIVIRRRYLDGEAVSFESVGIELGVSRERIRQIQRRALEKIAKHLGSPLTASEIAERLHDYFPIKQQLRESKHGA